MHPWFALRLHPQEAKPTAAPAPLGHAAARSTTANVVGLRQNSGRPLQAAWMLRVRSMAGMMHAQRQPAATPSAAQAVHLCAEARPTPTMERGTHAARRGRQASHQPLTGAPVITATTAALTATAVAALATLAATTMADLVARAMDACPMPRIAATGPPYSCSASHGAALHPRRGRTTVQCRRT